MPPVFHLVCLGATGDCIHALMLAKHLSTLGEVRFVIAKKYAPILDGFSCVKPVIWPYEYSRLPECLQWLRRSGIHKPIVCQSYTHPDCNRDYPYQIDAYRIAGHQNKFGTLPLIIDRRNKDREYSLMEKLPIGKPWVAVCTEGMSSPIPELKDLPEVLQREFPEVSVIDLSKIRGHRIHDLLGILDHCKLLVSIDTVFLHLARAAKCPVMAIVNDRDPWRASITPPATIGQFGYKNVTTGILVQAIGEFLNRPKPKLYHAAQLWGKEERNLRAYRSWKKLKERGMVGCYTTEHKRTFEDNGRKLPYINDLLEPALEKMQDHDVLLFTNDDIELRPEILDWAKSHVGIYGATSVRRDPEHIGRDAVLFTKRWLKDHPLPDLVLGGAKWDILVAAMIRHSRGIKTTLSNLSNDFYPAEDRILIRHEPHQETWTTDSPASRHNDRLFQEFMNSNNMKGF